MMARMAIAFALCGMLALPVQAAQVDPVISSGQADAPGKARSLNELLDLVKEGRAAEARENQAREQKFLQNRDAQKKILAAAEAERAAEERRSTALEASFAANDQRMADLQKGLDAEIGSMKELFGVLQYAAIDTRKMLNSSIVSGEYASRGARLATLADMTPSAARLPTIGEIETLWYESLREMTEAGKVVTFAADVMQRDGGRKAREVLRVGAFSLSSDDLFIHYDATTGMLEQLSRQPETDYSTAAAAFQAATPGSIALYPVDPTGGALLDRLVQKPSLYERVDHGGVIGYLIIGLGLLCLVLIGERVVFLVNAGRKLRWQMRSDQIRTDNALGRILSVYQLNKSADVETLEFRLNETIAHEVPVFERSITIIRVISLAAPLLGLLGTAIGFVQTFQAVSLLGSTGPMIVANGVAQAMVPTVLGLVVSIPALFAHNLIASMSRRIVQVLRQQSAGIVAVHAEREHK